MSAQRLVSVVCYSQQVSRVNAAIEGPRRIFEMRTETKIDMMRVNWRFPRVHSRRNCVYNRRSPARSSHSCANV